MPATLQAEVQFDQQGHLIIPDELMRAIAVEQGATLLAKVENGCLILEKRETVRQRLRARFAAIPVDVSLAGQLIADRRREADREMSL